MKGWSREEGGSGVLFNFDTAEAVAAPGSQDRGRAEQSRGEQRGPGIWTKQLDQSPRYPTFRAAIAT